MSDSAEFTPRPSYVLHVLIGVMVCVAGIAAYVWFTFVEGTPAGDIRRTWALAIVVLGIIGLLATLIRGGARGI